MKTVGEIKKILKQNEKELKEKYKIKEIMIFGSYVRNEQKKKSDIDILVDFYEIPDLLKFIEIGVVEQFKKFNIILINYQ